jgi:hypothetical protein|tara:strand:- start:1779 stop:1967 length:189 start_codon:yes stop_codon:yes gene_type:complete
MNKEDQRNELVNDLIATSTVMDELWQYHPDNPKQKDVVKEYEALKQMAKDLEKEIDELDASN